MVEKKGCRAEEYRVSGVLPAYGRGLDGLGKRGNFSAVDKMYFPKD